MSEIHDANDLRQIVSKEEKTGFDRTKKILLLLTLCHYVSTHSLHVLDESYGKVYRALRKLKEENYIQENVLEYDNETNSDRKVHYYRITSSGLYYLKKLSVVKELDGYSAWFKSLPYRTVALDFSTRRVINKEDLLGHLDIASATVTAFLMEADFITVYNRDGEDYHYDKELRSLTVKEENQQDKEKNKHDQKENGHAQNEIETAAEQEEARMQDQSETARCELHDEIWEQDIDYGHWEDDVDDLFWEEELEENLEKEEQEKLEKEIKKDLPTNQREKPSRKIPRQTLQSIVRTAMRKQNEAEPDHSYPYLKGRSPLRFTHAKAVRCIAKAYGGDESVKWTKFRGVLESPKRNVIVYATPRKGLSWYPHMRSAEIRAYHLFISNYGKYHRGLTTIIHGILLVENEAMFYNLFINKAKCRRTEYLGAGFSSFLVFPESYEGALALKAYMLGDRERREAELIEQAIENGFKKTQGMYANIFPLTTDEGTLVYLGIYLDLVKLEALIGFLEDHARIDYTILCHPWQATYYKRIVSVDYFVLVQS